MDKPKPVTKEELLIFVRAKASDFDGNYIDSALESFNRQVSGFRPSTDANLDRLRLAVLRKSVETWEAERDLHLYAKTKLETKK